MKSSLQTLSRIQKFNIDEQRKLLVEQQSQEDRLLADLQSLEQQFTEEKNFARANAGVGDFGLYVKRYLRRKNELEQQLDRVRRRIAEIRDVITEMFKEQKTFDIVEDRRRQNQQRETDANEQKMLDEIGTNTYIKHQSN